MLKKLRFKFILVNMTIVTTMLIVIFSLLYYSTKQNIERESLQMMRAIAMNPLRISSPINEQKDVKLPYFSVTVNRVGEVIEVGGGFFDLSDDQLLENILQNAYDSHSDIGMLEENNLRFLRVDSPKGQCFVFVDVSSERSILRNLIRTFLLIGFAAFLVFLLISTLLARWAIHPVELAFKQQKQFIADASHELKTPLTVIMTDAELLSTPSCTEDERRELSGGILAMTKQMRSLVESLLELARLDSGDNAPKVVPIPASELINESAMLFEPVFFEHEMNFSYEIAPDICVKGDPEHLKQLVGILPDNASKYTTPNGNVTLSFSGISPKNCLLTVSNNGDTICAEDLRNLFKRFYRADKARTGSHSFGLGLSIAETITHEMGGKIRAESMNGVNTFSVQLPVCTEK